MASVPLIPRPAWWRERLAPPIRRPFTDAEDAEVIVLARCGVTSRLWHTNLPDRSFGEIAERITELREQGRAGYPTPL